VLLQNSVGVASLQVLRESIGQNHLLSKPIREASIPLAGFPGNSCH
jgi:hypothetical protein